MSLRRNVVANYLGQGWAALMGLAFVPQYVRELGPEAFGLIGVFAILQAAVALLDFGLTPTLVRELARLRAAMHTPESIRDLLRSLELLYLTLTTAMVIFVWFGAQWMADDWLKVKGLSESSVVDSLKIMGFVLATRWMEQVYRGALQGLQDMVWLNMTQALLATLRWAGALIVLMSINSSVTAFFIWQGLVSALSVFLLIWRTYRLLPLSTRPAKFDRLSLHKIRGFAGGMFLGTLLGFLLMQADKLAISKLLPLDQLGYYTLATTAATGLWQLIIPMNTAVLPRLTEYVARADHVALSSTYLRSCEWMSAVIVAPALMLTIFSESTLLVWTGDVHLAGLVAPSLSLLSLGVLLNGLMNLPYMLQLAHGWVSLSVKVNLVAVLVVLPLLAFVVPRFGIVGAASVWVALNAACCLVTTQLMHGRLLPAIKAQWIKSCVAVPLVAGTAVALLLRTALPVPRSRPEAALFIAGVGIVVLIVVCASLPAVRRTILQAMQRPANRPV